MLCFGEEAVTAVSYRGGLPVYKLQVQAAAVS